MLTLQPQKLNKQSALQATLKNQGDLSLRGEASGAGAVASRMDYAASHIVYVDSRMSRALDGKHIQKTSPSDGATAGQDLSWEDKHPECLKAILTEIEEVRTSLKNILSVFNGGEWGCLFHAPKIFWMRVGSFS